VELLKTSLSLMLFLIPTASKRMFMTSLQDLSSTQSSTASMEPFSRTVKPRPVRLTR
jgi:hypothetical protein